MLTWIQANLATLIISMILLAVVTAIILRLIHNKRQGKSSCGCGCGCEGCSQCGGGVHPGNGEPTVLGGIRTKGTAEKDSAPQEKYRIL